MPASLDRKACHLCPSASQNGFWADLPRPIIGLAPMDGVTDAAFRQTVALQAKPDVTFTEFTSVTDVCRGADAHLRSFIYSDLERPIVAQLYGKDPAQFYQAAHLVCELGFDGLDINMGCPSRSVASSGSGAGLIRTPSLAHEIMQATRQGIVDWADGQSLQDAGIKPARIELIAQMNRDRSGRAVVPRRLIPMSVKTRLGFDRIVIEDWVAHLLEHKPATITIHGRTLEQMYRGQADWGAIARAAHVARMSNTLVLGNGDLASMGDIVHRVQESKVHGVLVGRGTLGTPWFFRTVKAARAACEEGTAPPEGCSPFLFERFDIMLNHARRFETLLGAHRFPRMRKHLGWYCKGFPHAAAMRADMVRTSSSDDVARLISQYQRSVMEWTEESETTLIR